MTRRTSWKNHGALVEAPKPPRRVRCALCGELVNKLTAHRHQGKWIGDECCWDERLRSTE